MSWRRHIRQLKYGIADIDPTLILSIIVPLFGIVFALCDVAIYKFGWTK